MRTTTVKETAILFSAAMARAIRDGLKMQTRRVIRPRPEGNVIHGRDLDPSRDGDKPTAADRKMWHHENVHSDHYVPLPCPYGVPGDRLVFLTGWATEKRHDKTPPSKLPKNARVWSHFDGDKPDWCGRTRMGRHMTKALRERMPRAALTAVRIERVQDISEADALCEGVRCSECGYTLADEYLYMDHRLCAQRGKRGAAAAFFNVFYDVNERAPRDSNPWVWALTFRRLTDAA